MMNISIPELFNNQPVGQIKFIDDFKEYVLNPGESWGVPEETGRRLVETYPFIRKIGGLKNIKVYEPRKVGDPNYLSPKSIINDDQVDTIDGLPKGDFYGPGVELDN